LVDYAVAFHLAAELAEDEGDGPLVQAAPPIEEGALESYERDMLLYAYRHVAPFRTHSSQVGGAKPVTLHSPRELVFESEGKPIRLICRAAGDSGQTRRVRVIASQTDFERSITVLTVVLRPTPDAESDLNEYDLIKLIKLWEGGERLPEPGSVDEEHGPLSFDAGDGFQAFVARIFGSGWKLLDYRGEQLAAALGDAPLEGRPQSAPSASTRHFRVGTVALTLRDSKESRRLFSDLKAVRDLNDSCPKPETDRWKAVVAVGGVLQGLLDFEEIGAAELSDVFGEAEIDDDSLLAFHKGTLLSISIEGGERDEELARPIGISPYLAVPHAVLLHNEQRIKSALIEANRLLKGQHERIARDTNRLSIEDTEKGLQEISDALVRHLPNIFHYKSERELYENGQKSRGFDDFEALVLSRREELQSVLERRRRRRDSWTLGLTITFFGVAALQVALGQATEAVPWWGYLLILAAIAAVLAQFRKQLF